MANPRPEYHTGQRLSEKEFFDRTRKTPAPFLTDESGKEITGPEVVFKIGERVVIKNKTYKVVYLNSEQVTLEPVSMIIEYLGSR